MNSPAQREFYRPVQQAFYIVVTTLGVLAVVAAVISVRWVLLSAMMGIGLGVLITPVMSLLKHKLRIPKGISAALFFLLMIGAVITIAYVTFAVVQDQIVPMIQGLPEYLSGAQGRMVKWLHRFPDAQRVVRDYDFSGATKGAVATLLSGLQLGATALGGFLFVVTIGLYAAVSPRDYLAGFVSAFPAHKRDRLRQLAHHCAVNLRRWFAAQLLAALTVGALTAGALWLIGIDGWMSFGFLTAALDLIPYVGPLVAGGATTIVTLATQPEKVWWVIGAFIIMQQIESDLVIPIIMKGRIELPPIHLLTLMLVFGTWFGILGVFIAPPLLTVLRTIYLMEYVPWMNQRTKPAYTEVIPEQKDQPRKTA